MNNNEQKGGTCGSCGRGGSCGCGHHSIVPILTILFASTFLLGYQGLLDTAAVNIIWPILVGIGGIVKITENNCECC
ncbi:MAG: hypothetical protein AAB726_01730 [Patescibacteria group bacterium]